MRFFYRGGYLRGAGQGAGKGEGQGKWGPPAWMWGFQDSGQFPFEPSQQDLKQEIQYLHDEKNIIKQRIEEIEKLIDENKLKDPEPGKGVE